MFKNARYKLTAWYLLIIMLVSISFSFAVFNILDHEVDRFYHSPRMRYLMPDPQQAFNLVSEARARLTGTLLLINLCILISTGVLGYFLAGRTLKPIKEMLDEQNRFISDASHELKTPLTALKSSMEVFLRDKSPTLTDAQAVIKSSLEDVDSLASLSASLLQLSRFPKQNFKLAFEQVATRELIESALESLKPLALEKHLTLENNVGSALVYGDRASLKQLYVLLIDNAIKYSPADSKITLELLKTDRALQIAVCDHGIGIPVKEQKKIFDRFYRVDSSRSKNNVTGYGLGLAIAQRIAQLHNATILVESKEGVGSKFSVNFQLTKLGL